MSVAAPPVHRRGGRHREESCSLESRPPLHRLSAQARVVGDQSIGRRPAGTMTGPESQGAELHHRRRGGDIAPHGLGRLSYRFAQRAIAVH
jgi:hypothetical protein